MLTLTLPKRSNQGSGSIQGDSLLLQQLCPRSVAAALSLLALPRLLLASHSSHGCRLAAWYVEAVASAWSVAPGGYCASHVVVAWSLGREEVEVAKAAS